MIYLYLHLLLSTLIWPLQAWMMVSKTGDIVLLGPLEINPGGDINPRVGLKSANALLWDMYVDTRDELKFKIRWKGQEVLNTLTFESFSVQNRAQMGRALSITKAVTFGRDVSVNQRVNFGSSMSVLDFFRLGSCLSVRSFLRLGSTLAVQGSTRYGSELSV
jgi:hypothetical protein